MDKAIINNVKIFNEFSENCLLETKKSTLARQPANGAIQ